MKTPSRRFAWMPLALLWLLTLLAACQPIQPVAAPPNTAIAAATGREAANKAVVQRIYAEAFNQKNLGFFAEVMDLPNLANHELDYGADGLDPALLVAGFPDLQATVDRIVVEGDMVTALVTFSGTHQGEFMGVAPTGKPMTISLIDIFRFQDGKVVELWHYVPVADILEQIGAPAQTAVPTSGVSALAAASDPAVIVKAFYDTMNNLEYEQAMAYFADDVVTINPSGTYTGTEANLAQYTAAWEAGIRLEVSSLRNVDGIVVYHVKVFDQGTLLVEGDSGITIVEEGKIIFDGDTVNMPPMADPTSPIAVIKAFYIALNAKEYDKAMTLVADDATLTDEGGSYQGKDEIAARILEAGTEGRSYDIGDISEVDGTVTYQAKIYQADRVIYETLGRNVVKDGKITLTATAKQ